jgi:adenine-specific DNA-methyltransferase
MDIAFKDHLEKLLLKDTRLVDDQGELKGNVVKKFANELDETLIGSLLEDDRTRDHFFLKVKDVYVFKANDFIFFLEQNKLDNSFTKYANRIGLTINGKFLKDNTDIVLDFPYKDCILEGGQSTEEGLDSYYEYDTELSADDKKKGYEPNQYNEKQAKRKEVFFNNIIAKDEIDRLLEPKAFTNILEYSTDGVKKPKHFNRNKAGRITDNLIIKGNNLIALHSLIPQFKGQIKMIYIDPPYYFRENKQEDTFTYNSNFKLSSWLTFMMSRLEIAKELLTNDGVIFISINEDGLCYLKILMDQIFKIDNFIEIFNWKKTDTPSNLPHKSKKASEYILCYEKVKDNVKYRGLSKTSKSNDPLTKPKNGIKTLKFQPGQLICSDKSAKYLKGEGYGTDKYPMELLDDLIIENNTNKNVVRFSNRFTWTQDYLEEEIKNKTKMFCSKKTLVLSYKKAEYNVEAPFDLIDSSMGIQTSENAGKELTDMFGEEVFKYPKPETLIEYLINIVSNKLSPNDIILDFHLGSGTTSAVAHKLGYQYIGIEQLEYINTLTVPRMTKVIEGDKIGISQKNDWCGGGDFIYFELAEGNVKAISEINECSTLNELLSLFDKLYSKYFLHYNIRIKDFKETIIKEDKFKALSLNKQKEMFCRMLDNNQLYVNRDEMEDKQFGIAKEDIALTKDFYQIKD